MKKEFQVKKEGMTNGWVTILSKQGESFNREQKIKKYLDLGYEVADLNGNPINQ